MPPHADLLTRFRAGQRAALARAISIVENQREGFQDLLHELHAGVHGARRIGITGPPGAGKSTLTSNLIRLLRERGQTVGVVAVDPTSPYTGGALLGDRIRMNDVAGDRGVFIRSMATRGALGGLAAATREVVDVIAAFGFDVVLVETVGVGQSELDIAAAADSTVVVLVPEAGDSIQTMKAGLMEAADLFVVNKADRPGAPRLAKEVEMMLHFRLGESMRNIPAHHGVQLNRAKTARTKLAARKAAARGEEPAQPSGPESAREPAGPGSPKSKSKSKSAPGNVGQPGKKEVSVEAEAPGEEWSIPVLLTTAETGEGLEELLARLDAHAGWLEASGELARRRRARLEERVRDAVQQALLARAWHQVEGAAILEESLPALERGDTTPYQVAARIVRAAAG